MAIILNDKINNMHIFQEKLLFDLEPKYDELLLKLGLQNGNNRFKRAFNNYKKLAEEMTQAGTQTIPEKWSTEFKYAVYDLTELLDIYNAIRDYPSRKLLKEKLKLLNGGLNSPAEETTSNNIARNIQFELKLFSEFMEAGIGCELRDPIPDLELASKLVGHSYAIECKRIFSFSDRSVRDNIKDAREQLDESLSNNPKQTGIIALDITRRLTQGTSYLRAKSEAGALARLSHDLDEFRVKYMEYFSPKKIKNKRILAILLHASMYTYLEDRTLPGHGAYTIIHEIHPEPYSKILFGDMKRDIFLPLARHKDPLNVPNIVEDPHRRF